MVTIHDKLKENSCVQNQPGAFLEVQQSGWQNQTLGSRSVERTKVPQQCGARGGGGIWWHQHTEGPSEAGVCGVWRRGLPLPPAAKPAFLKNQVKMPQQRGNCKIFPKTRRTAPKLVLPSANESVMLKIIYSIFNSDYTRQGDLNLITKLEGFKTNPFKSDTVD